MRLKKYSKDDKNLIQRQPHSSRYMNLNNKIFLPHTSLAIFKLHFKYLKRFKVG